MATTDCNNGTGCNGHGPCGQYETGEWVGGVFVARNFTSCVCDLVLKDGSTYSGAGGLGFGAPEDQVVGRWVGKACEKRGERGLSPGSISLLLLWRAQPLLQVTVTTL